MFVCCRVSTQLQDTWVEARVCTIVYWTQAGMLVEIIQAGWIVTAVRYHVDKPQVMIDQLFFLSPCGLFMLGHGCKHVLLGAACQATTTRWQTIHKTLSMAFTMLLML